jgi:ABC-2 type transport system permease protein
MEIYDKIKDGTKDIFYIWRKEMHMILHDEGAQLFIFFLCLIYPLLYSFIYNNEIVHEVPIVVVDDSNSSESREFLRYLDASPDASIVDYAPNMENAQETLRKQGAYGIVHIPRSFSKDIMRGIQTHISIYCDLSGLLNYKAIYGACTDVSLKMNKEIKISHLGNTTSRQDEISTAPIEYNDIAIFNPQRGMASFLIPAILILIIQQSLLLCVGLLAGTSRENNQFKDLVPIHRKYRGTLRIVMGKSIAYISIYSLLVAYVLIITPKIFNLIQLASFGTLAAFILPYMLSCIFFAMTVSIFMRNRESCLLIVVFTSVPLLFISGISWPRSNEPIFWKILSYIFPSTFGINGFIRINSMGALLKDVEPEFRMLWIQTGVYFITTCLVYRYQILLSRRHVYNRLKEMKQKIKKEV